MSKLTSVIAKGAKKSGVKGRRGKRVRVRLRWVGGCVRDECENMEEEVDEVERNGQKEQTQKESR
jgi:hypothetical protein